MALHSIDIAIIVTFLLILMFIGIRYKATAEKGLTGFFLGGRNLPWWIAGTSMVATTFAADTPLLVAGIIAENGVSGNWIWWNGMIGGMLTVYFFARFWRRANVITDLEFIELRYSGPQARFLRGFRAVYLGLFMNIIIIGWVNLALLKILEVFFDVTGTESIIILGSAMFLVMIYSSLSGLLGVAITDFVQFILAMTGCIVLALIVLNSDDIGGVTGLKEKLEPWRFKISPALSVSSPEDYLGGFTIGIATFLAYAGFQWWASWYPGAEPGGGGYVAQRMMSAKSEKDAFLATLYFQITHYCLRPWPWIIVGLCAVFLYPDAGEEGFVLVMRDYLPVGLKGLLLVAFLAAYMSTISTQLNWGASYLVKDLFSRFILVEDDHEETDYVWINRFATFIIMILALLVTPAMTSIKEVWLFLVECGAGLGAVLILRWYWWRISAKSELAATIAPFIGYGIGKFILDYEHPYSFFFTIGFTTISWLAVTFLTKPESDKTLQNFYQKIKPMGAWGPVRRALGEPKNNKPLPYLFLSWFFSIALAYAILFFIGKVIFQEYEKALILGGVVLVSGFVLGITLKKITH